MNTYIITYNGNSSNFKGRIWEVLRQSSASQALRMFYKEKVGILFEQEDGSFKDECGNPVLHGEYWIEYDGGTFTAEPL